MNKDDVQALARHGLTAGGGAGMVASNESLVQLISAAATIIGIIWSLYEKRQRPATPAPAGASDPGSRVLLFLLLPLLAFFPGCATSDSAGSTLITPQRVESVARLAAYSTASAVLIKTPDKRADLVAARDGFHALRVSETWDLQQMGIIAATHGLAELSSPEGMLILTGAGLFTDLFTKTKIDLRSNEYARAVVIGADDGLTLALGPATRDALDFDTLVRLQREAIATRPLR